MSILSVFQTSRPSASLWTAAGVQFSLPYFSISISLNVMLTLLLVSRLLYMSWELRRTFGADHAKVYVSIAAMILESGAPYAVVGLIFIITYARNSDVQDLALPVLSQVMVRRNPRASGYSIGRSCRAVHQSGADHPPGCDGPCSRQHSADEEQHPRFRPHPSRADPCPVHGKQRTEIWFRVRLKNDDGVASGVGRTRAGRSGNKMRGLRFCVGSVILDVWALPFVI